VIITVSNNQVLHAFVERNAADSHKLSWAGAGAAVRANRMPREIVEDQQSAVSAVENDDIPSVAIESNAWTRGFNEKQTKPTVMLPTTTQRQKKRS
jgi:hypothetical protein